MSECICSSCVNLKGIAGERGAVEEYECAFGYPSEDCDSCETGECEISCSHYIPDDEQVPPVIVKCSCCGRELRQECSSNEEGSVQCFDCFMKNSH